jgi:hypothetical protein
MRCSGEGEQVAQLIEEGGRSLALGHVDVYQRADLVGQADVSGEEEDGNFRLGLAHFFCDIAAVHSRHGVVEDDGIDGLGGEQLDAGVAVGGSEDLVAGPFEEDLPNAETYDFVVDAKDQMDLSFHSRKEISAPGTITQYTCATALRGLEWSERFIVR